MSDPIAGAGGAIGGIGGTGITVFFIEVNPYLAFTSGVLTIIFLTIGIYQRIKNNK